MAMASSFSPSSSYLYSRTHDHHHLTLRAPFSLFPARILFNLSQTLSSPNKFAASSIRCSNSEASSTPTTARKQGVSVYKPKSYEVLVTDAANSLACALDDGKTRLEIDFPPLPTSISSYKGSSDEFSDANVQLALAVVRKLKERKETRACIVFPDNPEKRRASERFKSAIDLIDEITIASLDDIPTGPVGSFFRSIRNTLDFDFVDENEERWQSTNHQHFLYLSVAAHVNLLPSRHIWKNLLVQHPPSYLISSSKLYELTLAYLVFHPKIYNTGFFLNSFQSFYIRIREYSKTIAVPPYIVNYDGALFRQYPGPWQVMLKQADNSYACVAESETRFTLNETKEELLRVLGLNEEQGSQLEFLRRGYKKATWWEEDVDLELSNAWRN